MLWLSLCTVFCLGLAALDETVNGDSVAHCEDETHLSEVNLLQASVAIRPTHKTAVAANARSQDFVPRTFRNLTHNPVAPPPTPPKLFVAIVAKRSGSIEARNVARQLWSAVDGGTGFVCARFAMCQAQDEHQQSLLAESSKFGDFLFLPCAEGYYDGLLTKKVIATMKEFRHSSDHCLNRPLMMKVDDDTFVAGSRFRPGLSVAAGWFGTDFMYAGVPTVDIPAVRPIRDPTSMWYEPYAAWSQDHYPPSMLGGPGYILGRKLVEKILDDDIADRNILTNEDKAVGAWINLAERGGTVVHRYLFEGNPGFPDDDPRRFGLWADYHYVLDHHLSPASITCLLELEGSNNPNAKIDPCFAIRLIQQTAVAANARSQDFVQRTSRNLTHNPVAPPPTPPKLFVAIVAKRSSSIETRNVARQLWSAVDGGTGFVCARFAMCQAQDEHQQSLLAESSKFGDFLFLPCAEGYYDGLLTKKVIATMKEFRHSSDHCLNRPLMMKVDDDTFVAGSRFRPGLSVAAGWFGTDFMYAGVPTMDIPAARPIRDPTSMWYEPYAAWSQDHYPPSMLGGPGYILGRKLVEKLLDDDIADRNILTNEDKAVGAWIYLAEQGGTVVHHYFFAGDSGFPWNYPKRFGKWASYNYVLDHHLSPASIACMLEVEGSNNSNAKIDPCFD